MVIHKSLTGDRSEPLKLAPDRSLSDGLAFQPVILAGDPNGNPPDSPERRIDPNTTTSPFAGVGSVRVILSEDQRFLGSGAAISRRHILTAAHVLDVVNEDGVVDPAPDNVIFNLNFGQNLSHQIRASELQIFPGYTGFNNTVENDIAIITLSSDLPEGVPIYPLNRTPLLAGTTITMVGYGTSGDGITGQVPGTASLTVKRVGQNQTEDTALLGLNGAFLYDFDGPDASTNLFGVVGSGTTLGNTIEATVGPGDSGGPSFLQVGNQLLLAGVNTFAFGLPGGLGLPGAIQGTFGTGGGGVDVADPNKLAWIDGILASVTKPGSLQGRKWSDLDGDRISDPGEPGLPGWTIYLDLNQNGILDTGEPSTQTDANGNYTFTNLTAGTYTVAEVPQSGWQQTFPASQPQELFKADFSDAVGAPSLDGFTIDNTGVPVVGLWHLSSRRGNDPGHSADDSLYFGRDEGPNGGGNYNVGHTAGRVVSPAIALTGISGAELSFSYFLRVETDPSTDQPRVRISRNGGEYQTVAAKTDILQPVLNPTWRSATIDLTPFIGSTIQIQFDFNTLDASLNNFEGWYVDDVTVRSTGSSAYRVQVRGGETLTNLNFGNWQLVQENRPENDFNGDGNSDLLWRNQVSGETVIWHMDGATLISFTSLPIAHPTWKLAAVTDFDGDRDPDILWQNQASGETVIWQMNGATLDTFANLPIAHPTWTVLEAADFDGDNDSDILWRNSETGENVLWQMNGTLINTVAALPVAHSSWRFGDAADFDGDGDLDLLWRNPETGENVLWQMNGTSLSTFSSLPVADANWAIATIANFDADSNPEILWYNSATRQVVIWQMNGLAYSSHISLPTTDPGWEIEDAVDLNADSRAEILLRNDITGANGVWFVNSLIQPSPLEPAPVSFAELPLADAHWRLVRSPPV
ncbi:FG-GAP-like repeat-containing protein [Leptothermofonsia sp. ETS-13]|uniref:FG-GAP-like repeat-containing protein n=1 Tax=Leptothermofonsia sp. ETS-13 TaxID=3035696 RepID=UPI003B9EE4D5